MSATPWFRRTPVQVLLGVAGPVVLGLLYGSTSDAGGYRPTAAFLAVVVVLALFCGPWAALTGALVSAVVIDIILIDHGWWLVPASWSQAAGLGIVLIASLTVVVLVQQRERARDAAVANERRRAETQAQLQAEVLGLQEQVAADRFRVALDSLPDLVAIQRSVRDGQGRVVDFVMEFLNHPDLPVGDLRRREMTGRRLLDLFPAFAASPVFEAMVSVATTGRSVSVTDSPVTVRATGETEQRFASVQIAAFGDGVIAVVRDVTERHRNVEDLERANEELAAAQHLAHIGVWRVDLERGLLILSDQAAEIAGLPSGEVPEWTPGMLLDLLDPSDRRRVELLIGGAQGGSFATETQLGRRDGSVRQVAVFGQVVGEDEPNGPAVWGTIQDLTVQRTQELALRAARDRLEQERTTVALLQEAIVPVLPEDDRVEVGATYLSAGDTSLVGGDWYDAFLVEPDRLVFAVGDVAGHGLPAAAMMTQLRNALRGLSFAGLTPESTIAAMNRLVVRAADDEMATCIVGTLRLSTGEVSWVCAGHPPPVLIDATATDGAVLLDRAVTVPLGMSHRDEIPVNRLELQPGSLVVLYSDGLIERHGEHLDVGLDRLLRAATRSAHLGAQAFCDALTADMTFGHELLDDLCLVVFRVPARE